MSGRSKTSVSQDAARADGPSRASGSDARAILKAGITYVCRVTAVSGSSISVVVVASGLPIGHCIPALPIFMGLAGYRTSCRFSIGDTVRVLYGNPSYVIGGLSKDLPDTQNAYSRTHTGQGHGALMQEPGYAQAHTYPNDLFDGEFEIANLMGMALVFCTNLMIMKAGDRAKVETHLVNDMVRIVSNEFRHHSALGDDYIFDDGRLSAESHLTSYRHESHGAASKKDLLAQLKNNQADLDDMDQANATLFARADRYIGWLGDFMHWFVSDPQHAVSETAKATIGDSTHKAGRSHIWTGNDGSILIQSVSDIAIERVVRVLVPRRKFRHDDPRGVQPDDFDKMENSATQWLTKWQDADPDRPWEKAFQLREYGRWLSQNLALARFRQASGDWEVPTEANAPAPVPGQGEEDVTRANGGMEWIDAYATIRIYRDGSIGLQETGGAAITMAHGSIWVSATRHLWFDAAGDIRFMSGQNILFKARRSIEFVATVGALIMKCRTAFRALCERGSMLLQSDAFDPTLPENPAYAPASGDPSPEILDAAVMLRASNGRIDIHGDKRIRMLVTGEPYAVGALAADDALNDTASVVIESQHQHVRVNARYDFSIRADNFRAQVKSWAARCKNALWTCASLFDVNGMLTLRKGKLYAQAVIADVLAAQYAIEGPESQVIVNHDIHTDLAGTSERKDVLEMKVPQQNSRPVSYRWVFQAPSEYMWDTADTPYVSPAQQTMTLMENPDKPSVWAWADDRLLSSAYTGNDHKPWGASMLFGTHTGGDLLNKISDSTVTYKASGWTTGLMSFRFMPYERNQ